MEVTDEREEERVEYFFENYIRAKFCPNRGDSRFGLKIIFENCQCRGSWIPASSPASSREDRRLLESSIVLLGHGGAEHGSAETRKRLIKGCLCSVN